MLLCKSYHYSKCIIIIVWMLQNNSNNSWKLVSTETKTVNEQIKRPQPTVENSASDDSLGFELHISIIKARSLTRVNDCFQTKPFLGLTKHHHHLLNSPVKGPGLKTYAYWDRLLVVWLVDDWIYCDWHNDACNLFGLFGWLVGWLVSLGWKELKTLSVMKASRAMRCQLAGSVPA